MKTVLITGASGGIGSATARLFYDNGYNIAANYYKNECAITELTQVMDKNRIITVKADVSSKLQTDEMIEKILEKFGKIDVLVNNAAIAQQKPFADITESDWDNMFNVNIKSMYNCTKAVIDSMLHFKCGSIINIASMWGEVGASCEVHYSASKAAVIGFTKALAKEMGLSGIRVNCVSPGVVDTKMNEHLDLDTITYLKEETPLMRIGTTQDIAKAIYFLASENASFITGQILGVNGGFII